jgi:hypothetical protein
MHRARALQLTLALGFVVALLPVPAAASEYGTWSAPVSKATHASGQAHDFARLGNLVVAVSAVGTQDESSAHVINVDYSTDGGTTWIQVNPVTTTGYAQVSVAIRNATTWYVVSFASLYRTADRGTTWTNMGSFTVGAQNTPQLSVTNNLQADIAYDSDAGRIVAAVNYEYRGGCSCDSWGINGQISISDNEGSTWTNSVAPLRLATFSFNTPIPPQSGPQVLFAAHNVTVAFPNVGNLQVYESPHAAAGSWTTTTLPLSGNLNVVGASLARIGTEITASGAYLEGTAPKSYILHRNAAGVWSGGATGATRFDQLAHDAFQFDGTRLFLVTQDQASPGGPTLLASSDHGATFAYSEAIGTATFGRTILLSNTTTALRLVGFATTGVKHVIISDRTAFSYVSAVHDGGLTFTRQLVDLETDWCTDREQCVATTHIFAREIGDDTLGSPNGRIFKLNGNLTTSFARDPCQGDYASPNAQRGLRVSWDIPPVIVTVCENNIQSPPLATIQLLDENLTRGTVYGYAETAVRGPFLVRSETAHKVGYTTLDQTNFPGQVRFDDSVARQNVNNSVSPFAGFHGWNDMTVDLGCYQDRDAHPGSCSTDYAAINQGGLLFWNSTTGHLQDSFDDATYHTGGSSIVKAGSVVFIAGNSGLQRWNYVPGVGINKVPNALTNLTNSAGANESPTAGALRFSKDQLLLTMWSTDTVWIFNSLGGQIVFRTPLGLFGNANIISADLDAGNNELYVATSGDVFDIHVSQFTSAAGDEGNPSGEFHKGPTGAQDPRHRGSTSSHNETDAPGTDGVTVTPAWCEEHFNTTECVAADDPDHDGYTNAEEQAGGTDPTNAVDHPAQHISGGSGGTIPHKGLNVWLLVSLAGAGIAAAAVALFVGGRKK